MLAALAAAVVPVAGSALPASAEVIHTSSFELRVQGEIEPRALPRRKPAPVALRLGAEIRSTDGGRPPQLRRMIFDIDRDASIDPSGLARCRRGRVENTRSPRAERVCGDALIGRGYIKALIDPEDQETLEVRGPMLAFNGQLKGGRPTMLFHVFARTPAPTVFVGTAKVGRTSTGRLGNRLRVLVPRFGGGDGSVTEVRLRLRRRWRGNDGKLHSYVSARCRRGHLIAKAEIRFADVEPVRGGFLRRCRTLRE